MTPTEITPEARALDVLYRAALEAKWVQNTMVKRAAQFIGEKGLAQEFETWLRARVAEEKGGRND